MIMGGIGLWVAVGRGFWRSEARGAVETVGWDGVLVVTAEEEESAMAARGEKERRGGACRSDTKKTNRIVICVYY